MIQITVSGRLGKDAEVRQAGTSQVINFSLATDVGYGDKKHSLWVDCSKFGTNTKVAEYLKKGTRVLVIGEGDLRKWEGGAAITVNVSVLELLGGNEQNQTSSPRERYETAQVIEDDDLGLPF